ncbi:avidin-like [Alligator sinensis]|uniref:Avidin-like n=1 Tax=Alligator sinensis TaxID=38654 RepID=A0A3Q0FZ53_ALLSI|nr:avidin-like [Alligator sinensis]XP_025051048.1 avidin-like [Alligator sinensis]
MRIFHVEVDGSFSGKYRTAVSATQVPIQPALLCGSQQLHGEGQQPTFSFTVNWKSFSASTTVFGGQCFVDKSREESLRTMWLLREEVNSEKDDWKAARLHLRLYWGCRPPPTPSHQPGLCTGSTSGCQLCIQHGEQQCYLALWAWAVHLSKL